MNSNSIIRAAVKGTLAAALSLGIFISSAISVYADTFGELIEKGFPPSYAEKLAPLADKYPNWRFTPLYITEMNGTYTFPYVLAKQTADPATNLVYPSAGNSAYRDERTGPVFDGGWYSANDKAVEYFLDPRNFIDSEHIFMFEDISKPMNINEAERICAAVLKGTFMEKKTLSNGKSFARYLAEIGAELGISAPFLAARIRLEQGVNGSPLSSGSCGTVLADYYKNRVQRDWRGFVAAPSSGYTEWQLKNYNGLYNFFNIGASGTGLFNIYLNAMKTAQKGSAEKASVWNGAAWNTDWKGLYGGALTLKKMYVSDYQNTLYLQKFNVDPRSSRNFWGQYMQNVMGAYTESESVAGAYTAANAKWNEFSFLIPVYSDMPGDELAVLADINRNGRVSTADADLLCYYIAGMDVLKDRSLASIDLNGDGKVDREDIVIVLSYAK
ncbi:MAG: hypothetical protein IJF74_03880 [Clostridia bacterium]|nr:hypothetical protein [Clostridia bacterium]